MNTIKYSRIIFSLLLLVIISTNTLGQTLSPTEAVRLAKNQILILSSQTFKTADDVVFSDQYSIAEKTDTLFYIFNLENNQGWIILSADKRVFPLLGWSPQGSYIPEDQAPSFRSFLQKRKDFALTVRQKQQIVSHDVKNAWEMLEKDPGEKLSDDDEVITFEPILGVKWDQGCGYNAWCPADVNGPCGRAFTGCVATAQGQIMKYWNYPPQGRGSHTYTSRYGDLTVDFSQAQYNWDEMHASLPGDEVAKLLYHVGVSVEMNYDLR
jgi:hypothetical protein